MSGFKTKKIKHIESKIPDYKKEKYNFSETQKLSHQPIIPHEHITKNQDYTKRKRRIRFFSSILLIIASLLFMAIAWAKYIGWMQLGGNIKESNIFKNLIQEKKPEIKGVKNILIAGIGGKWHPGWELTDSLMLASLNFDKKTVTMLSIPRDWYVATGKNSAAKINTLYTLGQMSDEWVNILAKKITEITGQNIHHYMIIDFSGFKSIVDALWGVEIDVPKKIYDREYPDENWWYEVFSLEKWLQTLDGKTALKFARSRHSSSDFDRSERQQLLLKAIKEKVLSLEIATNPQKIGDLIDSVKNNLSTDMTVGDLVNIGINFKDMDSKNIVTYNYNNECWSLCRAGGFLYQPSMSLFWNAWVLLPNGASRSKISKYDDTRRFADLIFKFPALKNENTFIEILTAKNALSPARNLRTNLEQYGFNIDHAKSITQTGEVIDNTEVIIHNTASGAKITEDNTIIQALKYLEPNISIRTKTISNSTDKENFPKIQITLGKDRKKFFEFKESRENFDEEINITPKKSSKIPDLNQKNGSPSIAWNNNNTTHSIINEAPIIPEWELKLPSEESLNTIHAWEWENF